MTPTPFEGAIDHEHKRVDPCFMTGKGCVYRDVIDRKRIERRQSEESIGFSVMPFRSNLNIFFQNCLSLFFTEGRYADSVFLERADEVRRPGIIVCEGICKRIQEADFITVDISLPNPNVFYEMGLAYGIGHKIVVLHNDEAPFGVTMASQLRELDCISYAYRGLDPLLPQEFDQRQHVWTLADPTSTSPEPLSVVLYEHSLTPDNGGPAAAPAQAVALHNPAADIPITFEAHVCSAVNLAIGKICASLDTNKATQPILHSYLDTIKSFRETKVVQTDRHLRDTRSQIDSAFCIIMRTGFKSCHPMTYFWLGYGHAKGKNVMPVTVLPDREATVEDLAFDIRAQRHMFFIENAPERFEAEVTSSFKQMIMGDFAERSRKGFWDHTIGPRGEVSIFTGALHDRAFGREMIGDWDLRTASELTSYLASRQYRARIESPVYTPEYPKRDQNMPTAEYVARLKEMMKDKNCILIASPDVNPLTEIVLGAVYGIPDDDLFVRLGDLGAHPRAMVVVKEGASGHDPTDESDSQVLAGPQRCFYREDPGEEGARTKRGFASRQIVNGKVLKDFISQVDDQRGDFKVLAHLLVLSNPFRSSEAGPEKFIIVLNGVSGPATFALTHVLTGGVTEEFVSYDSSFNPEAESEQILRKLMDQMSPRPRAVDCIVTIDVGAARDGGIQPPEYTADWRRILEWKLNREARHVEIVGVSMKSQG